VVHTTCFPRKLELAGMRIDSSHIGDQLRKVAANGVEDAEAGQRTGQAAERLAPESDFEPMDKLLLKRIQLDSIEQAATETISFADAQALADRTRQLMSESPVEARGAQLGQARERLRDLLGE